MRFGVCNAEDIWSNIIWNMAPLAPTGANCVYVLRGSRIACYDLVVGDPNIWAIFFVQCLHIINPVTMQNVQLEDEASQVCMPWSRNTVQR